MIYLYAPPVITIFLYNSQGNLTGNKDSEKNVVAHNYDSSGRKVLTEKYFATGLKIKTAFEYYPNDLLWKIIDDKGNTTEYKYDDQKRLIKAIYPDASTIEYTYTEKTEGDKKYKMIIEKQRNETVVTTIYDEMNRVIREKQNNKVISYSYGVENNLRNMTMAYPN